MKKYLIQLFAITFLVQLTFTSCATKMSTLHSLENLAYDLRDNSAYYNVEDWKNAGEKFMSIRKKMSEYKYTPAERRQIGELEGQCAKYMVNGVKDGLLNSVFGIAAEVNGILDAIKNK